MKWYLSLFRMRFITGLQYRAAAIAGIAFMGICGELAAEQSVLPGSFHAALLDAAAAMTPERFLERIRLE